MCGLSFLYAPAIPPGERNSRIKSSLVAMSHRGPDEKGIVAGNQFIAGHQRLSILDLASSHQPMQDPNRRFTLVYNGEIYNYQQLRSSLQTDWQFQTKGDTEVVLAGLCTHGVNFLRNMQGMWALALWDSQENKLLLSRDRMGKKPLYYCNQTPEIFSCASELPALRKVCPDIWTEDIENTADFFRYGFYLPGFTAYKEVNEVLPGHYLVWKPASSPEQFPYWTLQPTRFEGNKNQALEMIQSTFINAVKKRMLADVEIGAFLSGGIDSSLVVATMAKTLNTKPKTFTIGFKQSSYDERKYADLVAKKYGTKHIAQELSEFDSAQLIKLIIQHHGQPFGDASLLPTAMVSQLAAKHVKVALSGDGADELFSGYQRYQALLLFRLYFKVPPPVRKLIESFLSLLAEPTDHHSHSILKKAKLFAELAIHRQKEKHYISPLMLSQSDYQEIAPDLVKKSKPSSPNLQIKNEDDVMEMMLRDATTYLPQDILAKVDRASMAFSLETRSPFLDTELVELAFSFPREWHRHGFSGKRLLKGAFSDYLPNAIWQRRKQGFAVPIAQWFKGSLGDKIYESVAEQPNLPFNRSKLIELITQHRRATKDYSMFLWSLYVYLEWKNTINLENPD